MKVEKHFQCYQVVKERNVSMATLRFQEYDMFDRNKGNMMFQLEAN